jgi:hypothetical protein
MLMTIKRNGGSSLPAFFIVFLVVMASLGSVCTVVAVDEEDIWSELRVSFEAVTDAETLGGDVSDLVSELNSILSRFEIAPEEEYEELVSRLLEVESGAELAASVGQTGGVDQFNLSITILLFTGLLVLLVWAFFPVVYWKLWLRSKGDWVVS